MVDLRQFSQPDSIFTKNQSTWSKSGGIPPALQHPVLPHGSPVPKINASCLLFSSHCSLTIMAGIARDSQDLDVERELEAAAAQRAEGSSSSEGDDGKGTQETGGGGGIGSGLRNGENPVEFGEEEEEEEEDGESEEEEEEAAAATAAAEAAARRQEEEERVKLEQQQQQQLWAEEQVCMHTGVNFVMLAKRVRRTCW